jgi:WD40 repeat protein
VNGELSLHAADSGERITSFSAFDNWVIEALVFSNDGQYIFAASNTGAGQGALDRSTGKWNDRVNSEPIKMWNAKSLHLVRTFDTEGRAVKSLDISPNGRYLFAGLSKGLIVAWDVMTGREVYRFRPFKNFVILKLSPS